ncbi:MAG TPA: enoyl-CoA hydratase/isomerase family protein [Candidatus Binatia bacterium]|nr:enoyl-CoA hydratase/isomerase family protein [Candidatus Binatia bacterium]
MRAAPLTSAQLDAWSARSEIAGSPLSARRFLLVDADVRLPPRRAARIARWLRAQPCPTLAAGPRRGALARACDVHVASLDEAAALAQQVQRQPMAAATLVQLLRVTGRLPVEDALTAESLAYATLQAGAEHRRWLASRTRPPVPPREAGPPVLLRRKGTTLEVELNRPAARNAISAGMRDALNEAFALVADDPSIRRAHVSGRGKCFSIGGELAEFGTVPDAATGHAVRQLSLPARALLRCGGRVSFHLHGACIGAGLELPAFAARVTASPRTWFQLPELAMGLIPGAGGCVSLPRRVGRQQAAAWMISGERFDAGEARAAGLVDALREAAPTS